MLNFILGGAGTGKSEELIEKIRECYDTGKNILVIIPDQFSFEYDKKLYNKLGAVCFNGLTVLSFSRLAQAIFTRHGGNAGSYIGDCAKLSLIRTAIMETARNDGMRYYGRHYKTGSFIRMMSDTVTELCRSGVTPEELTAKRPLISGSLSEKTADVAGIYSSYLRLLGERGLKDSVRDISTATKVSAKSEYFKGYDVFIDEFRSFTADEIEILDVIISQCNNLTIALPTEKSDSKCRIFEPIIKTCSALKRIAEKYSIEYSETILTEQHRFLSEDIAFLSANVFRHHAEAPIKSENIEILKAPDPETECNYVAAQIKRLVMNGIKYADIAVVSGCISDYAATLEGTFGRYDIPYFTDMTSSVMHRPLVIHILSALDFCRSATPHTEDILKYAKTGLTDIGSEDLSRLENYIYCNGIDGEQWLSPFTHGEDYEACETTRKALILPLSEFRNAVSGKDGKTICREIYNLLSRNGAESTISSSDSTLTEIRERKQLWNILSAVFDELYTSFDDEKMSIAEFIEILRVALSSKSLAAPPQTLDAVTVSDISRMRLSSPRAVFIIGAGEGYFPVHSSSSGIFTDNDREVFSSLGIQLSDNSETRLNNNRFCCYTAISSPSEKLFISYPTSDFSGSPVYCPPLILSIAKMFRGYIITDAESLSAAFFSMTGRAAYYTYVRNFDRTDTAQTSLREYLASDEEYSEKLRFLDRIRETSDKPVADKSLIREFIGSKLYMAPTNLERYIRCPFSYFCSALLELRKLKPAEFDFAAEGTIVHDSAERLLKNYSREDLSALTDEEIDDNIKQSVKHYIETEQAEAILENSEFVYRLDKIRETARQLALHLKNEVSQSGFSPSEFEYKIRQNNTEPYTLTASDGTPVVISGYIDRVDTYGDYVRVVDYKRSKTFEIKKIPDGLDLQMLIYLAALGKTDKYSAFSPAGVLYLTYGDARPSLSRHDGEAAAEKQITTNYCMNGLVLDNDDVIRAMDSTGVGTYINSKVSTAPNRSKKITKTSPEGFRNLTDYIEGLIIRSADGILDGEYPVLPLENDVCHSPCGYCDFAEICEKSDKINKGSGIDIESILTGGEQFE